MRPCSGRGGREVAVSVLPVEEPLSTEPEPVAGRDDREPLWKNGKFMITSGAIKITG